MAKAIFSSVHFLFIYLGVHKSPGRQRPRASLFKYFCSARPAAEALCLFIFFPFLFVSLATPTEPEKIRNHAWRHPGEALLALK